MGLTSYGIDRVRVHNLATGVAETGTFYDDSFFSLVCWRSEHDDKLHQVYVNGTFAGMTDISGQHSMVVPVRLGTRAITVAVYAIEPGEGWIDYSHNLDTDGLEGRVKIGWARRIGLPFEGRAHVYGDKGTGQIDYLKPMAREDIVLWPNRQDKSGFGLARFGASDFGHDGSGTIGFGKGGFGLGEFGFDADMMSWISNELASGTYRFGFRVIDQSGVVCGTSEIEVGPIIARAAGSNTLSLDSFDKDTEELVVAIG